jgi:DNA-directed RNA polymerase specialized sigma24 family protein
MTNSADGGDDPKFVAAIDQLIDTERDAITCHYLLGLTLAETAVRLGRTEKNVAMLVFRGKRRLKDILSRTGRAP